MKILTEFGMTPSSRSRIAAVDADFGAADDPDSIENFRLMTFETDPPLIECEY